MTVPTTQLSTIISNSLDSFDIYNYIAIGDDNTAPDISDTALGNELLRKSLDVDSIKDTGDGTYRFQMRIALSEANSEILREIGIFDQATIGGNMGARELLNTEITKTSDIEVVIILQIKITANNI